MESPAAELSSRSLLNRVIPAFAIFAKAGTGEQDSKPTENREQATDNWVFCQPCLL
jgi:hypothetical protein